MCFRRCFTATILALAVSAPALSWAQSEDELDRKKIDAAVREAETEAAAFAAEIARRAEDYAEEAMDLSASVMKKMKSVDTPPSDGPIDFADMLSGAPQIAQSATEAPPSAGVMVFASFSMPEESLRALVADARAAGVPVMLRGFVNGSLGETARAMHGLLSVGQEGVAPEDAQSLLGGVMVDPRAFRIFDVTQVPAFIAANQPLPDCDGLDCSAAAPPHDRIAGNISLTAALETLASEGRNAPDAAATALAQLKGAP